MLFVAAGHVIKYSCGTALSFLTKVRAVRVENFHEQGNTTVSRNRLHVLIRVTGQTRHNSCSEHPDLCISTLELMAKHHEGPRVRNSMAVGDICF